MAHTQHRHRHLADDMRILKPGGPKAAQQKTGPRTHRITLDVGAELVPDPTVPEKIIPVSISPPTKGPGLEGIVGPGIPDGGQGAPNLRLAGSFKLSDNETESESSVQDLMLVIDAVTKVAQNVGARVNFLTLMDTANYQLGKGVIGEFPCDEGYSPLTRFAWLRHLPQLMRRVLVAELEYDKKFFYILDSEKRSEQIAIGVLHKRESYERLHIDGLGSLLRAAVRLRAVWQGLDGKEYRVQKLLHVPAGSLTTRLTRVTLGSFHSCKSLPAPGDMQPCLLAQPGQELDRSMSGSP